MGFGLGTILGLCIGGIMAIHFMEKEQKQKK